MFRLKSACCMSVDYTNSHYKSTTGSNPVQQLFYSVVHELFIYKLLSDTITACNRANGIPGP